MKTILAYGDSLTWGMAAATGGRHAHEDLWPTVLEQGLGGTARVINAGLNGRTTIFDDFGAIADRNGARLLPTVLATFEPLDLVLFMLGTNDLKWSLNGSAVVTAQGVKRLLEIVRTFPYIGGAKAPKAIVISPPEVLALGPSEAFPLLSPRTDEWRLLASAYRTVAEEAGAGFFDAASVATAKGGIDGVHLDAKNTRAIGDGLVPLVKSMLGG